MPRSIVRVLRGNLKKKLYAKESSCCNSELKQHDTTKGVHSLSAIFLRVAKMFHHAFLLTRSLTRLGQKIYLTIIPRARMGYESIAHEAFGLMGYWLRGYEGERNNCFSKIQLVGQKNIEARHLSQVKARHQSFFTAKTLQIWRRFSLLVGYNQEIIKVREWIPHIGPLTRVIHLNLFLDMVPSSSANFTRAIFPRCVLSWKETTEESNSGPRFLETKVWSF